MVKMLYGLQAKLDRPLAAALAIGVLLSYGAWCAIDFVIPEKAEE